MRLAVLVAASRWPVRHTRHVLGLEGVQLSAGTGIRVVVANSWAWFLRRRSGRFGSARAGRLFSFLVDGSRTSFCRSRWVRRWWLPVSELESKRPSCEGAKVFHDFYNQCRGEAVRTWLAK